MLIIDSSSSSSSPSLNDGEEEAEEAEEEGEEFILHSFSPWSSCGGGPGGGGGGGGGDASDGPIYGFGLRDYFRNINPRLGQADDSILTTTDTAITDIHESEAGVVSRRRRDNNDINTAVVKSANRKTVETRPRLRFSKGKEVSSSSSSSLFNSRNKAYPSSPSSSLLQPLAAAAASVTAPIRDTTTTTTTTNTATAAASGSSSSNKHFFEFALSEYPLYRHDNVLGGASTASASTLPAAAGGAGEYDPLSYLMEGGLEGQDDKMNGGGGEGDGGSMTTTMILGSEWEAFRRIGLGVGG